MLLGMRHANKTRIRSGCLGLCSPLSSPNLAQSKNCFIFSSTGYNKCTPLLGKYMNLEKVGVM